MNTYAVEIGWTGPGSETWTEYRTGDSAAAVEAEVVAYYDAMYPACAPHCALAVYFA